MQVAKSAIYCKFFIAAGETCQIGIASPKLTHGRQLSAISVNEERDSAQIFSHFELQFTFHAEQSLVPGCIPHGSRLRVTIQTKSATLLGTMQTKRPSDTCLHLKQRSLIQMTYVPTQPREVAFALSWLSPKRCQTRPISRCPVRQTLVQDQDEKNFSASEIKVIWI